MPETIDTLNRFMVAGSGDKVAVLGLRPGQLLTTDEALILAAWLVAVAGANRNRFNAILNAVLAT